MAVQAVCFEHVFVKCPLRTAREEETAAMMDGRETVRLKIAKSVEFSDVDKAKILAINAWNQSVNVMKNREKLAQMRRKSFDL